jgi:hypothetical protein
VEKTKENIFEKLSKVQAKLNAPKSRHNKFGNYDYRSCEDILQAVKPLLFENGLVLILNDDIIERAGRFYIESTATVYDAETCETLRVTAYARESETKSGMDAAQITGAASSYARKYALNGLFNIDDTKDADTDEYTRESQEKAKKATKKKTETADSGVVLRGTIEPAPDSVSNAILNESENAPTICNDCGEIITDAGKFTAAEIIKQANKAFGVPCCMKCGQIRAARIKADKAKQNAGG